MDGRMWVWVWGVYVCVCVWGRMCMCVGSWGWGVGGVTSIDLSFSAAFRMVSLLRMILIATSEIGLG